MDERDQVWGSDFGGDAVYRFGPGKEQFENNGEYSNHALFTQRVDLRRGIAELFQHLDGVLSQQRRARHFRRAV